MSRISEFEEHTQRRRVDARDFLDVEAEVSDDGQDDDEDPDDEDLADFIDEETPSSSSRKFDIPPPTLHTESTIPLFQHIFERYENDRPSSSIHSHTSPIPPSPAEVFQPSPSSIQATSANSAPDSGDQLLPPTPDECWDLLRAFATSDDITLVQLENRMRDVLGGSYDHSVWSPRFDGVLRHENNVLDALGEIDAMQAKDAATSPGTCRAGTGNLNLTSNLSSSSSAGPAGSITSEGPTAFPSSPEPAAYNNGALVSRNARTEEDALNDTRNAIRMHYHDEDIDWRWYRVRCMYGSESNIINTLRATNRQDLVKKYLSSPVSGHVYLQVRSMLPDNSALLDYLKSLAYFIYHDIVTGFCPMELGYELSKTDHTVMTLQYFFQSFHQNLSSGTLDSMKNVRPPLSLLSRAQINQYVEDSDGTVSLRVACPMCDPKPCGHDDKRKFAIVGEQLWIQSSLRMCLVGKKHIEPATSITSEELNLFLESEHPALSNEHVIRMIPPLSSWQFFENETVEIRANAWVELLPSSMDTAEDWIGEGVIQKVDVVSCVVLLNSDTQSVPKTRLRRKLAVHMMVELLPGATGTIRRSRKVGPECSAHAFDGQTGFVTALDEGHGMATVQIDAQNSAECHINCLRETKVLAIPTITEDVLRKAVNSPLSSDNELAKRSETYTGASPWIGIHVIVLEPGNVKRGEFARVQGVRRNDKKSSGLEVHVRYETISTQTVFQWVDYHWVRHAQSHKFLHDDGDCFYPQGFWSFKDGYKPEYTVAELHVGYRRKVQEQVTMYNEEDERRRREEDEERKHEQWRLHLMKVELQRNHAATDTQTAKSLAALVAAQGRDVTPNLQSSSASGDGSAWDPSSRTPPHPSSLGETPALYRYWTWQPPSNHTGGMTPRSDSNAPIRDGGAWDPSAMTPLHTSSEAGGMTPRYDEYSIAPDGSVGEPRANTASAPTSSSALIHAPSPTGANTDASGHWLATRVLCEALQGLDIVVRNDARNMPEQRVYLTTLAGLIVAREGKRTTRANVGDIIPFSQIKQANTTIAENPEKARKLYIVVRGRHVGKIGRSVGKWVGLSKQYDYRLIPVKIQWNKAKWDTELEANGTVFNAPRWDLVVIHETSAQMNEGNRKVSGIRKDLCEKSW
ncbi:hypothetical protein BDP27DRAFT_1428269 [Rhodocollybia butyracea]|uniref:Uncharacterized protein n=1 Tax=Rhodocollybia butyracea TaxID=206335 RepID=A0A9P5U0P7_9AGAR|nr:hypothetical protein BDP27DRAFT_1428269 [Rhodocollybia butyracea]